MRRPWLPCPGALLAAVAVALIVGACTDSGDDEDAPEAIQAAATPDQIDEQAADPLDARPEPPADAASGAREPSAVSPSETDPPDQGQEPGPGAVKEPSDAQSRDEVAVEGDVIPAPPDPTAVSERLEATEFKITPADAEANDEFAWSLAIHGDTLVSGAPLADDNGGNSGVAYVFRWDGAAWVEESKLTPEDGAEGDWFGKSAGISGDTAVVGANRDDGPLRGEFYDDDTGSAYVFVREEGPDGPVWRQQAKLRADPEIEFAEFGFDVEIDGDTIAVAAKHDPSVHFNTGAVYVFRREGREWVSEAKLLPSQGEAADEFGSDIAISGDTILVGANRDDVRAADAGAAYVYRRVDGKWIEEAILRAPDSGAFDQFGFSAALDGDIAVIAAPFHDGVIFDGGAAYVFERAGSTWTARWKLVPNNPFEGAWFGRSVGVAGNFALIGAPRYDRVTLDGIPNEIFNMGVSYVFQRTTLGWLQTAQLQADDAADGDDFGWTVNLTDEIALVGAWLDDTAVGPDAGSAYSYVLTPADPAGDP